MNLSNELSPMHIQIYMYIRIQYIQAAFNKCLFMKTVNTSQNSRVHFRLQQKCVSSRKMYKIIISKQDIELGYCVSNLSAKIIHSYTQYIPNNNKKSKYQPDAMPGPFTYIFIPMYKNITFDILCMVLWISVLFSWCYILRYH